MSDEMFFDQPALSNKFHIFKKGELVSLCGRWMFKTKEDTPVKGNEKLRSDDCKACFKKAGLLENTGKSK